MKEFLDEISLSTNIKMNELMKNLVFFEEKSSRFTKVQMEKRSMPQIQNLENRNFEESASQAGSNFSASFSGKSQISNYSKLSKKGKNKAKLKKIKEGSPLEEDFLINVLKDVRMTQVDIDNTKELITVLNYVGLCDISDELKRSMEKYIAIVNSAVFYNIAQQDFLNSHPELKELFPGTFTTLKNNPTKLKLIVKD
jgi:elongator complex protein 1